MAHAQRVDPAALEIVSHIVFGDDGLERHAGHLFRQHVPRNLPQAEIVVRIVGPMLVIGFGPGGVLPVIAKGIFYGIPDFTEVLRPGGAEFQSRRERRNRQPVQLPPLHQKEVAHRPVAFANQQWRFAEGRVFGHRLDEVGPGDGGGSRRSAGAGLGVAQQSAANSLPDVSDYPCYSWAGPQVVPAKEGHLLTNSPAGSTVASHMWARRRGSPGSGKAARR